MKKYWVTILIITFVIVISVIILTRPSGETPEETAKCIGENSELYVKLGCHACEIQEDMFGENYKYLNVIDCFYENEKCSEKQIIATPTWIINGQDYIGVKSIDELKELTGCSK